MVMVWILKYFPQKSFVTSHEYSGSILEPKRETRQIFMHKVMRRTVLCLFQAIRSKGVVRGVFEEHADAVTYARVNEVACGHSELILYSGEGDIEMR